MNKPAKIAIVGWSCRLPGASSVDALWQLLLSQTCSVSQIPEDRWCQERFFHPRQGERGKSYTWAAGVLDDIWGFDPTAFGLSPREAEQMDPQQRLLLELTWEALEDAWIKPSVLSGSRTGVFVGASALDYGQLRTLDIAAGDPYFATGNTLSIISNRISYIFNLKGPSFTIDTACSSALVALNEAIEALRSGRVDTAIVAGVNILASPFGFIGFSQATMLSRLGLCQPFSASADGYVRAEGGVVLVLKAADAVEPTKHRVHGLILGSKINSDGRTSGISLPSMNQQANLLRELYDELAVNPDNIAFLEAHGTGTPVGDPIEAKAIGEALGERRAQSLLIGSIKGNIGHTEPASGLAGVLKAALALKHRMLPPSLHCGELNPHIPFEALNLNVCRETVALPAGHEPQIAGVNSFGFGGTNAHVVLSEMPPASHTTPEDQPSYFMLSAHNRAALSSLIDQYAKRVEATQEDSLPQLLGAAAHRRDRMRERFVAAYTDREQLSAALSRATTETRNGEDFALASALAPEVKIAFAFTGNGGQWVGMGLNAYRENQAFRARFAEIDQIFKKISSWSLIDMLHSAELSNSLAQTSIAQPLIFALQAATSHALKCEGLSPAFVFGHSVGEVAAAEAAGILSLEDAVRVIHFRSLHQEQLQGCGGMAVVIGAEEAIQKILAELPGLEIAAYNNHSAYTLAGDGESIASLAKVARRHKARVRPLDIAYPFHSKLMDPIREPLLKELKDLVLHAPKIPFLSTVDANASDQALLDADYWWRNIRSPVYFKDAVLKAARLGAGIMLEVGPDVVLLPHIKSLIASDDLSVEALNVLDKRDAGDPIRRAVASALALGAEVEMETAFGTPPAVDVALVPYQWQRQDFRLEESSESTALMRPSAWHPLIGARLRRDKFEWQSTLDLDLLPFIADHQVNGQVLLPGTAFLEMGLAVAQDWLNLPTARLSDVEILQPLFLEADTSREVICRLAPDVGRFEISSRPRMSTIPWQLHAVGRILKDANCGEDHSTLPAPAGTELNAEEIYAIAHTAGLEFGPRFRNLAKASRPSQTCIRVDLQDDDATGSSPFALDPARLDSCFHGLIFLFADLMQDNQPAAFVPISFGQVNLLTSGTTIAAARIDILSANERAILANYVIFDAEGRAIASLKNVRYQALPAMQDHRLETYLLVESLVPATEPTAARLEPALDVFALSELGRQLGYVAHSDVPPALVLMEGWATAVGWDFIQHCADRGRLDLLALFESGRIPASAQNWILNLAATLEHLGLIEKDDTVWRLAEVSDLPDPVSILQSFAADHPDHNAELLLMAGVNSVLADFSAGDPSALMRIAPKALAEGFELGGVYTKAAADFVIALLDKSAAHWPKDRALRILQIGYGPLSSRATSLASRMRSALTIFEPRRLPLERARLAFGHERNITIIGDSAELAALEFDLIIAADSLHRVLPTAANWQDLQDIFADGAVFCALEPLPSLFRDTVFGLDPEWFRQTSSDEPAGAISGRQMLSYELTTAGLHNIAIEEVSIPAGKGFLAIGQFIAEPRHASAVGDVLIIVDDELNTSAVSSSLATLLAAAGMHVAIMSLAENLATQPLPVRDIIYLTGQIPSDRSSCSQLTDFALRLKTFAAKFNGTKLKLWFVTQSLADNGTDRSSDFGAAISAFSRTLGNEYSSFEIKRVGIDKNIASDATAERISQLVLSGTDETDIVLSAHRTDVLRFERPDSGALSRSRAEALHLVRGPGKGFDRLAWLPAARRAPGAEEVEIEVEATGLNFRDLMWALGLLPETVLENGFAGPTLGLECAGRILRVGTKVSGLKVGDDIIAFARNGFATHLTLPAAMVTRRPEGIDAEAAATIPVAFLTAYYSLITCARLKPREWVVIHGGAGGVGLAALQIALWRRARVIATASTHEKRALLTQLGAEHVFDSRSGALFDDVRHVCPEGVHVVLNSLSGEAMERSIGLLRPFGRFVELGKRDYVANTFVGLRPFNRNLTYFGVDLDQLMVHDKNAARKLLHDVMGLFTKGHLSPLPYRSFAANEIIDALHLMQQAGHVGKLVVKPPRLAETQQAKPGGFTIASDKTHLITGGLGGFGLETARWLIDHGARHIVLVGRNGPSPTAQSILDKFAAEGADVRIEACDVTDKDAAKQLFAKLAKSGRPLAGVFHEAMVLDDALLHNLTKEQAERVLRPKVQGAEILDRLTSGLALDYFVLFSSATTIIGNPGQAAYVMANGFMEGLARRRRKAGLPGLAVAWGAIEDVGVLAGKQTLRRNLADRVGVKSVTARGALDLMMKALSVLPDEDCAMFAIAPLDWAQARQHLATLQSPTYALLARADEVSVQESEEIDIKLMLTQKTPPEVSKIIADEIAVQIARVLRLPPDTIARNKPLAENGLDSLMAVELALALEKRFGLTAPLTSSASGLTVSEVADQVLALVTETSTEEDSIARGVADRHLGPDFDQAALADVRARIFEKSDSLKGILH